MKKIAIIGAGIAGLTLAHKLRDVAEITIFEKSRGVAGRLSTRYYDEFEFDHGAQYFTIKTPEFAQFMKPLIDANVVVRWDAKFAELDRNKILKQAQWSEDFPHYVGSPRMNHVGKFLAKDINISLQTRVQSLTKTEDSGWVVIDDKNETLGQFDWVISTAPAKQTEEIFQNNFSDISSVQNKKMLGCFALMLGFNEPLDLPWEAALVNNSNIGWIAVNSSKPGRPESFSLLIQSANNWAEEHLEEDPEKVKNHLLAEFSDITGIEINNPSCSELHRWRYANITRQDGANYLLNETNRLAACGDWCVEGRVEGAFISANELSKVFVNIL